MKKLCRLKQFRGLIDILCEEMLRAEERVRLAGGSGPGLDASIPGLEAPAAHPALHLDAEVPVGAEAPLG